MHVTSLSTLQSLVESSSLNDEGGGVGGDDVEYSLSNHRSIVGDE